MKANKRIIFAMGGGGFSMEPENPLLDLKVLSLAKNANPKICFLATASGDAPSYIERFYDGFQKHPCRPSHLSLFRPDDVVKIGGIEIEGHPMEISILNFFAWIFLCVKTYT